MSSDNEIRNLGYIAWKNDLSWMETQNGDKWEALIHEENQGFKKSLKNIGPLVKKMQDELRSDTNDNEKPYILYGWKIEGELFGPQKKWTHMASGFSCKCWDADLSEDIFAAVVQDPDGFERFTIEVYSQKNKSKPRHLKTLLNCGPYVAIIENSVIFLQSEKDLRYSILSKWSEAEETVLFQLNNLEENLELGRGEDGSVYLIRSDFTKKKYSLINANVNKLNEIKWTATPHLESCIVSDSMSLPFINKNKQETIESFSIKAGWTVTISRGIRTLWKGEKPIVWIWGDISYDSRNPYRLDISDIRYESYTIMLPEWKLSNPKPVPFPCSYYDNPLPVFVVHPNITVKGLLVTAYGAYGTPTHVGSLISRWKPLLLRGWIIASIMVPGSGDDSKDWIRDGQRLNRLNAIEQLTESIKSMQEEHGIAPLNTALYGRSAGGLLVASVAIRNPGLIGSLYLESPYLDILRTMSNPDLPLTTLETSEYGTSKNPANVIATAIWSPMEHIPEQGIPELLVIARTDLADLQVLPYELLKFIKRVRGPGLENGQDKLVYIHSGLGHFTTSIKSRAEDMALLESAFIESPGARIKNLGYKYKMLMSRKNRNMTRKNKDRKNKDRKNKNRNVTMGGRRRRSGRKH
uniref:Peptidase S9 prolyl oligopeptidase catalytic domain-containing protein n=1 Tax=viral metagenome TaxID=1070528 RepID=A0A6C0ANF8_9ZZZZ